MNNTSKLITPYYRKFSLLYISIQKMKAPEIKKKKLQKLQTLH